MDGSLVPIRPIEVFFSYAHKDEALRDELAKHLMILQRRKLITQWHDRCIVPGTDWAQDIAEHLDNATLILLLISPDFIASDFCYSIEMERALERHHHGEALVIPIIVRPVAWEDESFARLQVLPTGGKPVSRWRNHDEAFLDVIKGITHAIKQLRVLPQSKQESHILRGVWNVPFQRNLCFTNRDEVFQSIERVFWSSTLPTALFALSGIGGIGKTQMAVEYAYRRRASYRHVFWILADTHETFMANIVDLAMRLHLLGTQAQDQHAALSAVRSWLQEHDDWLLIFDNADNPNLVRDLLPFDVRGHILVTTRLHALGGFAYKAQLPRVAGEEGALMLLRRAHILDPDASLSAALPSDIDAAKKICELTGGLPLAINQAAGYIEEYSFSVQGYLTLFQDVNKQANLLRWRGVLMSDQESVAQTFVLSFQRVAQENPVAADLLRLCAFLHPDAIPEALILRGAPELGPLVQNIRDEHQLNEVLGALLRISFIQRNPSEQAFSLHRLVQIVLRDMMDETTRHLWAERAVRALQRTFPDPRFYTEWELCRKCLPQVEACTEWVTQWKSAPQLAAQLFIRTGYYLMRVGRYPEAGEYYQQAQTIAAFALPEEHTVFADVLYRQGELLYIKGQYADAEPLYLRALAIRERLLGAEHQDVALSLHNLALLYYELKKATTEEFYQRALKIWEQTLGPDHPDVAECLNNLAGFYRSQGRFNEAEPLLLRALAIRRTVFGEENPDSVLGLITLGQVTMETGKLDESEQIFQRALEMCKHVLGPEHTYVATCLLWLGQLAERRRHFEQAEQLYQQALAQTERALGSEHPYLIRYYRALAHLAQIQGNYELAKQFYQQALQRHKQAFGAEHPDLAPLLESYTSLLQLMQREKDEGVQTQYPEGYR